MAKVEFSSPPTQLGDGILQLQNAVAMDGTLRFVTDQNNTTSPLKLSTTLVQTLSTLKITTADNPYIDAEDNSGNNRFTIGRDPASQQVNLDFASNPTGSTTAVGAIRTYVDGTNLSEVMTFREDGNVGIGTTAPTAKLDVRRTLGTDAINLQTGSGGVFIQSDNGGGSSVYVLQSGVGIGNSGGIVATARLQVRGSGSTSATTSLLVQNSVGNDILKVTDNQYVTIQNIASNECLLIKGVNDDATIRFTPSTATSSIVLKSQASSLILSTTANDFADVRATSGAQTLRIGTNNSLGGGGVNYYASQNGAVGYHKWFFNDVQYAQLTVAQYVLDDSGTLTRNDSAILQANSTTKGFLPPRMTTAQKNAIVTPAIGLMIFDTNLGRPCFYNGAWVTL